MKKVKFALAGVALVTAAMTMSFTMTNNDAKSTDAINDCWSTEQLHRTGQPADRSTELCPDLSPGCCVKPNPNKPGEYIQFSQN